MKGDATDESRAGFRNMAPRGADFETRAVSAAGT